MCGIFGLVSSIKPIDEKKELVHFVANKLKHRGGDYSGSYVNDDVAIAHERLAIVDVKHGAQPIVNSLNNKKIILSANGEIYNFMDIRAKYPDIKLTTDSDCESIISLYLADDQKFNNIESMMNSLNGDFAFFLYNETDNKYLVARDPIGVCPLYYAFNHLVKGQDARDSLIVKKSEKEYDDLIEMCEYEIAFASESKALSDFRNIYTFPSGSYFTGEWNKETNEPIIKSYYNPEWKFKLKYFPTDELSTNPLFSHSSLTDAQTLIKNELIKSVQKRLMTDVPFGVLLSGGLDSSLIASITNRLCKEKNPDFKLQTFSISLKDSNSTDEIAARKVADYLGTIHTHFYFTIEEGLDLLDKLIYHLESYDITTIRASMPMFILSKKIRDLGIKMVLSGEGSDEIFGGYLYFHNAPNPTDLRLETIKRVNNLHLSDCLRANKSTMAHSLEVRVPFLDRDFLDVAMNINPNYLMVDKQLTYNNKFAKIEKWFLRAAFQDGYLPDEILWRQKEQFSDGVGYGWIDNLKKYAENQITMAEFKIAPYLYPFNTPTTKEGFYYRHIFEQLFPIYQPDAIHVYNRADNTFSYITPDIKYHGIIHTVQSWVPQWCKSTDPSGRAQEIHEQKINV